MSNTQTITYFPCGEHYSVNMSVYCLANSGKSIKTMGPKVALSTMYLHRKISTAY